MSDRSFYGPTAVTEPGYAVAMVGTGLMGSAMARRLAAAGLRTTVWDRQPPATGPRAAAGALVAGSARDALASLRVALIMLPTAEVVEQVIFDGGVAVAFADGAVWA